LVSLLGGCATEVLPEQADPGAGEPRSPAAETTAAHDVPPGNWSAAAAPSEGRPFHTRGPTTPAQVQEKPPGFVSFARIINGPQITAINYGPSVTPALASNESEFYSDLVLGGRYLDLLNEYAVGTENGAAHFSGVVTINPQNGGPVLQDQDIQNELSRDIDNGWVPRPGGGNIYVVQLPPGMNILDQNGNLQCAYHYHYNYQTGFLSYTDVAYAVISDWSVCFGSGGPYNPNGPFSASPTQLGLVNDMTVVISHEIIEAMTDPDVDGTNSFLCNGFTDIEIGDCCQQNINIGSWLQQWTTFQGTNHAWFVERPWSQRNGNCGQEVPPAPNTPSSMQSSTAAVARTPSNLDLFRTVPYCSRVGGCRSELYNDWWGGSSWGITGVTTGLPYSEPANAVVAATARTANNLDAFYFDRNGVLATAYWSAGASWGAFEIAPSFYTGAPAGALVTAVARTGNALDAFHVDHNGNLAQYTWTNTTGWRTRTIVLPYYTYAKDGQSIAAVARTANNIDLFFVGGDHNVWTTFTYDAQDGPAAIWSTLQVTSSPLAAPNGPIAAAARTWANLDVYWSEYSNGLPMTSAWSDGVGWATFQAYNPSAPPIEAAGSGYLSMVTRTPYNLDAYYISQYGDLVTSSWTNGSAWTAGLVPGITSPVVPASGFLGAATRAPGNLDIFHQRNGTSYNDWWFTGRANYGVTQLP
jgi:hypothetical protein